MVGRSIVVKETEKDVISELCRIIEQCAKVSLTMGGGVKDGKLEELTLLPRKIRYFGSIFSIFSFNKFGKGAKARYPREDG